MKRVTGIGGVFFRARNPKRLGAWYAKHLGISVSGSGGSARWGVFEWKELGVNGRKAMTVWAAHPSKTTYFGRRDQDWMLNYRVADLEALLAQLRAEGIREAKPSETSEFGKFGWITDPEGNRLELWEPPGPRRASRRTSRRRKPAPRR